LGGNQVITKVGRVPGISLGGTKMDWTVFAGLPYKTRFGLKKFGGEGQELLGLGRLDLLIFLTLGQKRKEGTWYR